MENQDNSPNNRPGKNTEIRNKGIRINPEFEPLNSPDTFRENILELQHQLSPKVNDFPVEVFPSKVQEIVKETKRCLLYPPDFIGAAMLYAISVAVGNSHVAEIMRGWRENAVLFMVLVGRPGTNKSHPISFALKPIQTRDAKKFSEYKRKMKEYETASGLTQKERQEQGFDEPSKPYWEQHIVSDFTPEALIDVQAHNRRGLGVYADELATWFKNFDRYHKGSEEQFWLSVWSHKTITVNRKTSEPLVLSQPFMSVCGTIQPAILNQLADKRTENGFLDRLLFVFPENIKKEYWSDNELNTFISEMWQGIVDKVLDIPMELAEDKEPQPRILKFLPEARELLFEWQKKMTDEVNSSKNTTLDGICAKMEMCVVRLALILQMMHYACLDDGKEAIGTKAVEGAIKLVEYFKRTAIRVHAIIKKNTHPLASLSDDKQRLYKALPKTFETREGIEVAGNLGFASRTFTYFIKNNDLFIYLKRGVYEKRF